MHLDKLPLHFLRRELHHSGDVHGLFRSVVRLRPFSAGTRRRMACIMPYRARPRSASAVRKLDELELTLALESSGRLACQHRVELKINRHWQAPDQFGQHWNRPTVKLGWARLAVGLKQAHKSPHEPVFGNFQHSHQEGGITVFGRKLRSASLSIVIMTVVPPGPLASVATRRPGVLNKGRLRFTVGIDSDGLGAWGSGTRAFTRPAPP